MGYDLIDLRYTVRLERHNSEGDKRGDAAYVRFQSEVRALIDSDPDYRRIFGVAERLAEVEVG